MTEKSTLSFEDLYIELAQIYKSSQQQQEKVGLLTAAERRHSATLFENLMKGKIFWIFNKQLAKPFDGWSEQIPVINKPKSW